MMKYFLVILILMLFFSCKTKPGFENIPTLKFESISSDYIEKGDTLFIQLSFTDGDGDIGFPDGYTESNEFMLDTSNFVLGLSKDYPDTGIGMNPDWGNLLVKSSLEPLPRLSKTPEVPNKGTVKSISGTITMKLPFMFCTVFTHDYDTVIYSIQLYDRADHSSNTVTTPAIIYKCK